MILAQNKHHHLCVCPNDFHKKSVDYCNCFPVFLRYLLLFGLFPFDGGSSKQIICNIMESRPSWAMRDPRYLIFVCFVVWNGFFAMHESTLYQSVWSENLHANRPMPYFCGNRPMFYVLIAENALFLNQNF